jgi:two-component system, sensor histidine kinase LadS
MNTNLGVSTEAELPAKNILLYAVIILVLAALLSIAYISTSSINELPTNISNNLAVAPLSVELPVDEITSSAQNNFLIGGMVMLSFATLILFLTTKTKINLLLFLYCITRTLLLTHIVNHDLMRGGEYLSDILVTTPPLLLLTSLSALFMLLFTVEFFSLQHKHPTLYKKLRILSILLFVFLSLSFFITPIAHLNFSIIIQSVISIFLLGTSIYLINNKQALAKPFALIIAIQFVFLSAFIITQYTFGINNIKYINLFYGLPFWVNAFFMISLLSHQYFIRLIKHTALQQQALSHEKEARQVQEALLTAQLTDQAELESKVQERTLELTAALQELEERNRELAEKNTQDDLTGLHNRRYYDHKIQAEYRRSKRNLTPLSIVIIDIDHFKKVNDTHGHLAGDACLTWIGKHIKSSLKRSTDIGCRYGGEEFCLILPDTDTKGAMIFADNLREQVAKLPFSYQEEDIEVQISCGVSTYLQQKNVQPEQLFNGADQALYQAKQQGRNRVIEHIF